MLDGDIKRTPVHPGTLPSVGGTPSHVRQFGTRRGVVSLPDAVRLRGTADRFRAVVDVAPAGIDDVTIEADSRRLRLTVDRGDHVLERTVTPLTSDLAFGEDREASYNNGILTISLVTRPRTE